MTTRNQKTGIAAAVLGLAGGLFAWYKYKNSTPEEKENIKRKLNEAGTKLKETYLDAESRLKDTYTEVEDTVADNYAKLKNNVSKETDKISG